MTPLRRIVVGTDGSDNAARALRWAAAMGAALGSEVVAVHALGLLATIGGETVPSQAHRPEIQAELEGRWCAPLRDAGIRYRCELVDGNPVTALLAAADEADADLIVVGRRGHGAPPGLELGSTSRQLVEHAGRTVVVVPH